MDVGNNIMVKFKLFDDSIKYDIFDGCIVLYDHSNISEFSYRSMVFTGISLDVCSDVSLVCEDLYYNTVEFIFFNKYIYVNTKSFGLRKPVCIISFRPSDDNYKDNLFYGRFIRTF